MMINPMASTACRKTCSGSWLKLDGILLNSSRHRSKLPIRLLHQASTKAESNPQSEDRQVPTRTTNVYPFSEAVISSPKPIAYDSKLGLMGNVEKKLISTCANQEFHNLFRKNHPESIRPLSIVKVESYTNAARTTTNVFTGVLMAVKRRGPETSFRLRTILEKVGVEMKFNVFSPIIKNITVIKRAGDLSGSINGKPLIRKPRRAKLFYLRHHPEKMPDIRKISKAVMSAQDRS